MKGLSVRRGTKESRERRLLQQKVAQEYLEKEVERKRDPILRRNRLTGEVAYYS